MTENTLFVFDTNTLISALLFAGSIPAQALQLAKETGYLVCSDATYAELQSVLMRSKFDKYLSNQNREQFLINFKNSALWTNITDSITDCRDPKDNKFLEVAISAKASYLISGDNDLLVLHPFRNVQIVTPTNFLLSNQPV